MTGGGVGAALLSLTMLATFALIAGGLYWIVTRRDRRKGALMLIAALVLFANVLILTL